MKHEVLYGRRLPIQVLKETARVDPDRHLISIPKSPNDPCQGWRALSFAQLTNAVDHMAHWLESELGRPEPGTFPTLAYIGLSDVRYYLLMLAAIKVGYVSFFPSPRNNIEAIVSLFTETRVDRLIYSPEHAKLAESWLAAYPTNSLQIPPTHRFLKDKPAAPYPYDETFLSARRSPAVILHSSGTTGVPKAIVMRNGLFCTADTLHKYAKFNGFENVKIYQSRITRCIFTPVPLFHAYAILKFMTDAIYFNVAFALGVPELPVTADTTLQSLEHSDSDGVALTPSMLDEVVDTPGGLGVLRSLKLVINGGGAASSRTLDVLRENKVTFMNIVGSTETGSLAVYYQPNPENWEYFIFNDAVTGAEYSLLEDNLYAQRLVRKEHLDLTQGVFVTFPEKNEYTVGDMYEPHPTLPNHWKYRGRSDGIIVFSTGEKLNPVSMEDIVGQHPEIKKALVAGRGQFQASMILEPKSWPASDEEREALIDRVWPYIENANAVTIYHGRVSRKFVMVASPNKPFPYTPKGSLRRNVALVTYADEINNLYEARTDAKPAVLDMKSLESTKSSVGALFQSLSESIAIGDDDDLFLHGIDSLQAIEASRRLTAGLKTLDSKYNSLQIEPRDLYREHTVTNLARYLFGAIRGTSTDLAHDNIARMQSLVDEYTAGLKTPTTDKPPARISGKIVILTGSTGSLGSYMLHLLIRSPDVDKVICLNRSADGGRSKQLDSSKSRGLSAHFDKVTFLHADLSQPDLGLAPADLFSLRKTDCIIHNAWPVNFNLTVHSFEAHIRGTRHLIDIAINANRNVAVVFVSSIATVSNWAGSTEKGSIPEAHISDLSLAAQGYGESKLVSGHILYAAAQRAHLPVGVIRLGQVGGPTTHTGQWNRQEWLPTLVESSVHLGVLPGSLGGMAPVAWMPVDKVARIVLDVVDAIAAPTAANEAQYFNLVNPTPVPWSDIYPAIQAFYQEQGRKLRLVSTEAWVEAVRNAPPHDRLPALKLLDTFEAMTKASERDGIPKKFDTDKLHDISKTFTELGPVTPELMSLWCLQWDFDIRKQGTKPRTPK